MNVLCVVRTHAVCASVRVRVRAWLNERASGETRYVCVCVSVHLVSIQLLVGRPELQKQLNELCVRVRARACVYVHARV